MYQEKPDLHTLRGAVIWGNLSDISGSVWDAYWPVTVGICATQTAKVAILGSFFF